MDNLKEFVSRLQGLCVREYTPKLVIEDNTVIVTFDDIIQRRLFVDFLDGDFVRLSFSKEIQGQEMTIHEGLQHAANKINDAIEMYAEYGMRRLLPPQFNPNNCHCTVQIV